MSRLRSEIRSCIRGVETDADGLRTAVFKFPREFIGFQGHFPDQPVLPGICILLAAVALLEASGGGAVRLTEVVSAKFIAPVGADEDLRVECRAASEADGTIRLRAKFRRGGDVVARSDLRVVREASEAAG